MKRFWNKVAKGRENECWLWIGTKTKRGYGWFYLKSEPVGAIAAHRFSYWLYHKKRPILHICHTCDNPTCVNPRHLFEASPSGNMRDSFLKGRGKNNPIPKSMIPVIVQLAKTISYSAIAKKMGLHHGSVARFAKKHGLPEQFISKKYQP